MSAEELLGVFGFCPRLMSRWLVVLCCWEMVELESDGNSDHPDNTWRYFNQVWLTLKCIVKRSTQCTLRKICLQYSSCVVGFGSYAATNVHQQSTNKSKKQLIRFSEKLRLSYLEEMDAVAESFLLSATALGQVSSLTLRIEELQFSHGTSKKIRYFKPFYGKILGK